MKSSYHWSGDFEYIHIIQKNDASEIHEEANFASAWDRLKDFPGVKIDGYKVWIGHMRVYNICMHIADFSGLEAVRDIFQALQDYPVLDDDVYNEFEAFTNFLADMVQCSECGEYTEVERGNKYKCYSCGKVLSKKWAESELLWTGEYLADRASREKYYPEEVHGPYIKGYFG